MKLRNNKSYGLKDYKKREVNLLPSDFHKVGRLKATITVLMALFIIAVGAFGYFEYTVYKDIEVIEGQTSAKRAEIIKNQRVINNQKIILTIEQRIAKKEFLLDYIFLTNRSISEMIEIFEKTLNGEVYLTSLTADSSTSFVISASALSHEAISYTINQLKLLTYDDGTKYFDDVFTQGIVRNEDEDGNVLYLFQLNCEFGGGLINEAQ
ncbi:MAG: hypothetical protein JEZ08_07155 [Clostridiales bacterium]|nr:hypothetical protein [Clostridiales bacterium]